MTEKTDNEKKKILHNFHTSIFLFPFVALCFYNIYSRLFLLAFSPKLSNSSEVFSKFVNYGINVMDVYGGAPLILFILVYIWARTIFKFISQPENERLRKVTRYKIENISKSIIILYAILFIRAIGWHYYKFSSVIIWDRFIYNVFPALLLSFITQTVFSLIYVHTQLFGFDKLFSILYSKRELYRKKGNSSFQFSTKIQLLTVFNNIIPVFIITYLLYSKYEKAIDENLISTITYSLYYSVIITLVGLGFLSKGFSRPIFELNKKMDSLAHGNFEVKSRIYSNDEIAELKFHFNSMVDELKERENIRDMFGKYLSIEIAKKLLEGKINLGGDEVTAAVLFSDIRNFTSMSEKMTASEVIEFLNRYFEFVTEPILKRGGVINKFIGDAVMVIFSPVFGNEEYCDQAIMTAVEMKAALVKFNEKFPEYGTVDFGVGIHAGKLAAGNVGVKERLEYTVIGDTVNLASRLESKTKELKQKIVVSKKVFEGLTESCKNEVTTKSIGTIHVKGKEQEVEVFSIS